MTLVIAGFDKRVNPWGSVWSKGNAAKEMENHGLFAVADSLITTAGGHSSQPLLSGLRKIHSVPVKLWKPYFVDTDFRDYLEVHYETECFIAFAGSTLTATHALDVIATHLSTLRISFDTKAARSASRQERKSHYVVRRDCEYIEVRDSKEYVEWGLDMFLESDFQGILTADRLADDIKHSIDVALKSAKKYRLDQRAFEAMRTDFAAGIQCPATGHSRVFVFRTEFHKNSEGVFEVFASRREVGQNEIVVLGMRKEFEERAQTAYDAALHSQVPTGAALFDFLNKAIDEVAVSGSVQIDRPSVHKRLEQGRMVNVELMRA
jgi:hypothetical protein